MVLLEALLLPSRAGGDSGLLWECPGPAVPSLQLCSGCSHRPCAPLQPKQGAVEPESIQNQHEMTNPVKELLLPSAAYNHRPMVCCPWPNSWVKPRLNPLPGVVLLR